MKKMDKKTKIMRHIAGYAIGITIFLVLIPWGLYHLASLIDGFFGITRIASLPVRIAVALPLLLVGLSFAAWSNASLFFRGKGGPADGFGIAVSPRTERLVTTGPYRYTRNPMVFGALSCYFSLLSFLGSIGGIVFLILLVPFIALYLRVFEERRLVADFGKDYERYRHEVSMIFPISCKKGGK